MSERVLQITRDRYIRNKSYNLPIVIDGLDGFETLLLTESNASDGSISRECIYTVSKEVPVSEVKIYGGSSVIDEPYSWIEPYTKVTLDSGVTIYRFVGDKFDVMEKLKIVYKED